MDIKKLNEELDKFVENDTSIEEPAEEWTTIGVIKQNNKGMYNFFANGMEESMFVKSLPLKQLLDRLSLFAKEDESKINEAEEPKRYIVNSIGEGDNVDQQEFDDICKAVDRYRALKDTRHNEIIDTKHDEIICTNG